MSTVLKCDGEHCQVLLDLLSDVSDREDTVQRDSNGDPEGADVHRLVLLLSVHLYGKEAMKLYPSDVWPNDISSQGHGKQMEPSSPLCMTKSWGKDSQHSNSYQRNMHNLASSPTQLHATEFMQSQETLVAGFRDCMRAKSDLFISMILDCNNGKSEEGASLISVEELDRLGFLLRLDYQEEGEGFDQDEEMQNDDVLQDEMEEYDTQKQDGESFGASIWSSVCLHSKSEMVESEDARRWLSDTFDKSRDSYMSGNSNEGSSSNLAHQEEEDIAMIGTSPHSRQTPMFNKLISTTQLNNQQGAYGAHRLTILRGETDCEGEDLMNIMDCHDSIVYCLAPLKWVHISCCTNSIVVLGAVGRCVRVEKSERLQVIAVTLHVVVHTCHDCIIYVATNRPPLMLGDNRFVQLAPYNAGYENLEVHMNCCGVSKNFNQWDKPVLLIPDHPIYREHHHSMQQQQQLDHSLSVTLLPSDKLMPFIIPFRGGKGPLCGGAAPEITRNATSDTLTGLLTQEFVEFVPSPFPLPVQYLRAWQQRMEGVNKVRQVYRGSKLTESQKRDFTASVQSHFKEWLQSGGGMREVYDLAKVEKEHRR